MRYILLQFFRLSAVCRYFDLLTIFFHHICPDISCKWCPIRPPAWPFLTYFILSAQHPLLAWQPHSCMSWECQLVARLHCPRWKVICHCAAFALQPNVSKWQQEHLYQCPQRLRYCIANQLWCRGRFSHTEISVSIPAKRHFHETRYQ